jgi:hypothetical protein
MTQSNDIATKPQSTSMRIATTVTETKSVEKEITLPYYFKNKHGQLCKVVTNEFFIAVDADKNWWGAMVRQVVHNKDVIATGEPITADGFEAAYSKAMMYVDLICKNQEPSNEHDENEEIERNQLDRVA